jgi:hypothetical protein
MGKREFKKTHCGTGTATGCGIGTASLMVVTVFVFVSVWTPVALATETPAGEMIPGALLARTGPAP